MKKEKFYSKKKCPICHGKFIAYSTHAYHVEGNPKKQDVCSFNCESASIKLAEERYVAKRRKKLEAKYSAKGAIENGKDS